MTVGVDYPWSHPAPSALKAAGIGFAMRYLSTDASKNLTKAEASALAAAGIWVGVVWETTANRMLSGHAGGVADAAAALKQANACGMPSGRPIYFAADWDVSPAQQADVNAYLQGAASVLGGVDRVGVYGGFYTVQRALNAGAARWAWQTSAWSGGQWEPRANIRQPLGTLKIGGVSCDKDTAVTDDFGQWMPGKTPEDDMPLSTADKTWISSEIKTEVAAAITAALPAIAKAVAQTDGLYLAPADRQDPSNKYWTLESVVTDIDAKVRAIAKKGSA